MNKIHYIADDQPIFVFNEGVPGGRHRVKAVFKADDVRKEVTLTDRPWILENADPKFMANECMGGVVLTENIWGNVLDGPLPFMRAEDIADADLTY